MERQLSQHLLSRAKTSFLRFCWNSGDPLSFLFMYNYVYQKGILNQYRPWIQGLTLTLFLQKGRIGPGAFLLVDMSLEWGSFQSQGYRRCRYAFGCSTCCVPTVGWVNIPKTQAVWATRKHKKKSHLGAWIAKNGNYSVSVPSHKLPHMLRPSLFPFAGA